MRINGCKHGLRAISEKALLPLHKKLKQGKMRGGEEA